MQEARLARLLSTLLVCTLVWAALWAQTRNPGDEVPVIRADVDVVNILATVRDKRGHYVADLDRDEFDVYEDGVKQKIEYFNYEAGEQAQPLTIVLLIDTSGSVKDKLRFEQQAAGEFLQSTLRKDVDLAAVVQFDSEVNLVQDFTYDYQRLEDSILEIRAGGATKLYDSIFLAVEDLLAGEVGRKVIVVLSDGADTQSVITSEQAIRVAQNQDVLIYGIGVRSAGYDSDFGKLKEFANATGGLFFKSKASLQRLRDAFEQINQEIKNQYSLGYISTNPRPDGSFRRISVRLKRSSLKVTHRKGYYAGGPTS